MWYDNVVVVKSKSKDVQYMQMYHNPSLDTK